MTITAAVSESRYAGNGTTGPFAYNFRIFAATDLRVVRRSPGGVETLLAYPGGYTVAGIGSAAGSITTTTAVAVGETLVIRRVRPITQEKDIRNTGAYLPEVQEDALDHGVMIDLQQQHDIDRSLKFDESVDVSLYDLRIKPGSAGQVLGLASDGTTMQFLDGAPTPSTAFLSGAGSPEGVVAGAVGAFYRQTDGANGKVFWRKRSGSGNTGWGLLGGDTGVANIVDFGADPTGVADSTAAIVAAIAASLNVYAPEGTYKTTSTIAFRASGTFTGAGRLATFFVPTAGIGAGDAFTAPSDCVLSGFAVYGNATTNATGISIGRSALTAWIVLNDITVSNFLGASGEGILVDRAVNGVFRNVTCSGNFNGLVVGSSLNVPTNFKFDNCIFYANQGLAGVRIFAGQSIVFDKCDFESNYEYGLYADNLGIYPVDFIVNDGWFEDNWFSLAAGAPKHGNYHLRVGGTDSGDQNIMVVLRNVRFDSGATVPRAVRLANVRHFVIDRLMAKNISDYHVLLEGTSTGNFLNWPTGYSGAFTVGVFPAATVAYTAEKIQSATPVDGVTSGLAQMKSGSWTPVGTNVGGSGITYAGSYVRVGSMVFFTLMIQGTNITGTRGSTYISGLPYTVKPGTYPPCMMADIAAVQSLASGLIDVTNIYPGSWTATSGVAISGFYETAANF